MFGLVYIICIIPIKMAGRAGIRKNVKPYKYCTSYYRKLKNYTLVNKKLSKNIKVTEVAENAKKIQDFSQVENVIFENHEDVDCCSDFAYETSSDSESSCEPILPLKESLRMWALKHSVTHSATDDLLQLLNENGIHLPRDSRSLLLTPRNVQIVPMGVGEFWFHGLKNCLINAFQETEDLIPGTLFLNFNMDGLPISHSSKSEFWPILCSIFDMPQVQPMVIGIYYGKGKPPSSREYLDTFVDELNDLIKNGIDLKNNRINIKTNAFICDTPARCFIKGTVNYNHYHGCMKCTIIGEYYNDGRHMSFPRIDNPLRTDMSFRNRLDPDHHKFDSPIEKLPVDIVKDFPIADSLHLLDLGVMRKCLQGWVHGGFNFKAKLSSREIDEISSLLHQANRTMPTELHRAVRGLDCLRFWKGLEFRTFLLYLGPVILKDFLSNNVYSHFLMLFCAVTICTTICYAKFIDLADQLFKDYVELFIDIYGIDSVSSNVHNLIHIVDDVKRFGPLPNISSYPFENSLYHIKRLLRHGKRPLAQVAKRLSELSCMNFNQLPKKVYPFVRHENKHTQHTLQSCDKVFHTLYLSEGFLLKTDEKNKWFLTKDNKIVKMLNATYFQRKLHIYGVPLKKQENFFERPLNSSRLNIYMSDGKECSPMLYKIDDVKCKLVSLKYHEQNVYLPLIHTLK